MRCDLTSPQVPQLLENYHNQNADGLSLLFVLVWTIGDIANVTGTTPSLAVLRLQD